jgi:hypothetical protein
VSVKSCPNTGTQRLATVSIHEVLGLALNDSYWHFSELPDRRANVCLSEKFGRTCERVRLPPLTQAV